MGVVYEGRDPRLPLRRIVIKVMLDEMAADAGYRKRFKVEAKLCAGLDHKGIVKMHDISEAGDKDLFIVMEYLEGETLDKKIEKQELAPAQIVVILRDAAEALDYAHNKIKDFVHRDVKPANIMVLPDGSAKILDFGLATSEKVRVATTAVMNLRASWWYAAPERYGGKKCTKAADLWALGVIAYEALAGARPFDGGLAELTRQVCIEDLPYTPALNDRTFDAINKALNKDPGDRYSSCTAFVNELEKALDGESPRAPAVIIRDPQGDEPTAPNLSRRRENPEDKQFYVWVPPGVFRMGVSEGDTEGYDSEKPAHEVTITKGFWLGETPVTQRAWRHVMGNNPSHFIGEDLPVECVSWNDAKAFCKKIGALLPTEAQWEYAARGKAGSTPSRYGELDRIAWHDGNSQGTTNAVGQWEDNGFGLYDILGNVWEWTEDWYKGSYNGAALIDPKGPEKGTQKVLRGGSWFDYPRYARASNRWRMEPTSHLYFIGFRCALE